MNPKKYGADKRYLVNNIKERNYSICLTAWLGKINFSNVILEKKIQRGTTLFSGLLIKTFFYNIVVLLCGWILVPSVFCKCSIFSVLRQGEDAL